MTNLVISDKLTVVEATRHIYLEALFDRSNMDARGYEHGTPTVVNLTGKLNLAADRSFSIRMEMLLRSGTYSLPFDLPPGTLPKNLAQLVSSEQSTQIVSNYKVMDSSGDAGESTPRRLQRLRKN